MRRVIFTLLHDRGQFMLSRNFRLQAVGGIEWLLNNYVFADVSRGLDELMVLDVSRGERDLDSFSEVIKRISGQCFIPLTAGGGVKSLEIAQRYLLSGADKVLVNSAFHDAPAFCQTVAGRFGRQCVVAGIDYTISAAGDRIIHSHNGTRAADADLPQWVQTVQQAGAGELLFQCMSRDGTGMGLDLALMDEIGHEIALPCIIMGGVGKTGHIVSGLQHPAVDAVATANLFNFIGSTFLDMRRSLGEAGVEVAHWSASDFAVLRQKFGVKA